MVKRRTISEEEKIRRIKSWASSVGLDGQKIADQMVAKYGVDQAYKLASGAMSRPADLAKQQGVKFTNSKNLLTDLAKDAPETSQIKNEPTQQPTQTQKALKPAQTQRPKGQPILSTQASLGAGYNPSRVAPIILNKDVEANRKLRQDYIDTKFPKLEEKDFKSHDEYVAALRKQYEEMRQFEYGIVAQQETLDMYNLSRTPGFKPNKGMWTGDIPNDPNHAVRDSSFVYQGRIPGVDQRVNNAASCAVTATRVNNAICERMGYEGKDRFYTDYASCPSAKGIHDNPATKAYKHSGTSLKKMIEQGHVGPGTILSVPSKTANSGYHALTVAEVIRDKNGKITDVVLQANNSTSLRTYSVSNIDQKLRNTYWPGSKTPFLVTSTHEWMDQKIQQEAASIPEAELEARLAKERECLGVAVDRLATIEDTSTRLEGGYIDAVKKQTAEIQNDIVVAQNDILTKKAMASADVSVTLGVNTPGYMAYSAEERANVRQALLGMNPTSFEHMKSMNIAPDLKADRDVAESQFGNLMASYSAENGKGDDKKSMALAAGLLRSFLLSDEPEKSLDNFHKYVEQATQSNANLNMALIYRARSGNSMA